MPRYKLRTLLILVAVLPPFVAVTWFYVRPGPWADGAPLSIYFGVIAVLAALPVMIVASVVRGGL